VCVWCVICGVCGVWWDHHCIYSPPLTETSLCSTWLYWLTSRVKAKNV